MIRNIIIISILTTPPPPIYIYTRINWQYWKAPSYVTRVAGDKHQTNGVFGRLIGLNNNTDCQSLDVDVLHLREPLWSPDAWRLWSLVRPLARKNQSIDKLNAIRFNGRT